MHLSMVFKEIDKVIIKILILFLQTLMNVQRIMEGVLKPVTTQQVHTTVSAMMGGPQMTMARPAMVCTCTHCGFIIRAL